MSILSPQPLRDAAPAYIDTVQVPGAGPLQGKQLTFQVSCELMKNHLPASPVSPTADIRVAQDSAGKPMIFTIGSDQRFHLLRFDAGTATGWSVVDLGAGFAGYATASAFDVSQDLQGNLTIAVALAKPGAAATDLFVASMLSNDDTQTDWANFGTLAKRVTGLDPAFVASKVALGSSDDQQASLVIATGALAGQQYYYQCAADGTGAKKLEFPENLGADASNLQDMAMGYAFGQRGLFFLYKTGDGQTLECTTFATPDLGAMHYDYSAGNQKLPAGLNQLRYNCLATTTGSKTDPFTICSDVYVGTNGGVYLFRDASVSTLQKVTDQIGDVHQLIVTQDAQNISVWAWCSPNKLYYIAGKKGATYTWSQPILFSSTAIHLAPIRSRANNANELFLVNQDQTLSHYWQDPGSTLWQQRLINVKGGAFLHDVESFTTQLRLEDERGVPLANQTLKITASQWTYVTANGLVYSLDVDVPAEIPTDAQGTVTVIALASDIATPVLHIAGDGFAKTLNIFPNGKVHQGLQAIRTGDDLKNARTAAGQPVADPTVGPDALDGIAGNIGQLTDAGAKLADGDRPLGAVFVTLTDAGLKHSGKLDMSRVPVGFSISLVRENGAWTQQSAPLRAGAALGGPLGTLEDLAGDVLHFLESAFEDALKAVEKGVTILADGASVVLKVVEEGLSLVLTLADKVFSVVLKTLACVFKALNWMLKLVGIDLTKILAWLGHLLGWDDIWDGHKVIADVIRNGLDYAVERTATDVAQWRTAVDGAFDGLERQLQALILPDGVATQSPITVAAGARAAQPGVSTNRPQTGFAAYQMQHGGMLQGTGPASSVIVPFEQFVNDVVTPTITAMLIQIEKVLNDLMAIASDPSHTIDALRQMALDLIGVVLEPIRALVDGVLTLLADLTADLRDALGAEMDLPFLSSFYEFITDLLGEEEAFSFVNAIALLLAIPIVEIGKAVTGSSPLKGMDALQDPGALRQLIPAGAAPHPAMRAMLAGDPPASGDAPGDEPELTGLAKAYKKTGGVVGPLASLAADQLGFFSYGQGGASGPNKFDKASATAALAASALTFPVDGKGDARTLRITAWALSALNALVWWKLPNDQLKGGWAALTSTVNLGLSLAADGISRENGLVFASDILTNIGNIGVGACGATEGAAEEIQVVAMALIYFGDTMAFATGLQEAVKA